MFKKKNKLNTLCAILCSALLVSSAGVTIYGLQSKFYSALTVDIVSTPTQEIKVGDEVTVSIPEDMDLNNVTVTSSADSVVSVGELGINRKVKVTGKSEGEATVTVTDSTNSYEIKFTVKPPEVVYDSQIKLSSVATGYLTISSEGSTPTFNRKIENKSKLEVTPTVESTDTSVATAEIEGSYIIVKGKHSGTSEIIVKSGTLDEVRFKVNVTENIEKYDTDIDVSTTDVKIHMDSSKTKSVDIENYKKLKSDVSVRIEDSDIVSVTCYSDHINIKGKKEGTTYVTLYADGARDRVIDVRVYDDDDDDDDDSSSSSSTKITGIKLEDGDSSIKLAVDKKYTLDVELKPSRVKDTYLKFKSSNSKIASVDSDGKVTAKKEGTCTITAYYSKKDSIDDTIKVIVTDDDGDEDSSSKTTTTKKSTSSNNGYSVKTKSGYTATSPTEVVPYVIGEGVVDLSKMLGVKAERLNYTYFNATKDTTAIAFLLDDKVYSCPVQVISIGAAPSSFKDVPATHWAYSSISQCVTKGYLKGVNSVSYQPSATLNYADTFTALSRVFAERGYNSTYSARSEVDQYTANFDATNWAYIYYKNIISKLPKTEAQRYTSLGDKVMYGSGIARIHLANILYNTLQDKCTNEFASGKVYNDIQSNVITDFVSKTGLMQGDNHGNFNPNGIVTRAELATILLRVESLLSK